MPERRLEQLLGQGLNVVVAVTQPIPDPAHPGKFLAEPGDEIVFQLQDPDFPIVVRRTIARELLATLPRAALTVLGAYEPGAVYPVSLEPAEPQVQPAAPSLKLVV